MIVRFEGREFEFDTDKITVDEWRELKRKYKMTPKVFQDAINEADPDASTFAYWVMIRGAGQPNAILGDNLKPDIIKLNHALMAAIDVEEKQEAADEKAALAAAAETAAAAVPTLPAVPPSPEPPSPPDTTPQLPAQPQTATASSSGSGAVTSSSSEPSTSSSSPGSAGSELRPSAV